MKTNKLALKLIEECKQTQSKKLDLGYCDLREIPKEIFELTWLEELIISNSYWDYQQNKSVESKNSGGINFISSLPEGWSKLNRLKKLFTGGAAYYSGSQWNIKSYSPLWSLSSIEHLDLGGNQLQELPKEIAQLTSLNYLGLRYNQLQELPKEIAQLTNLNHLDLYGNKLQELPKEIAQLTSLNHLDLRSNKFQELPKEIIQLTNLNHLDLRYNKLQDFPKCI